MINRSKGKGHKTVRQDGKFESELPGNQGKIKQHSYIILIFRKEKKVLHRNCNEKKLSSPYR